MAAKAKNSKKHQQAGTTAMVTLNPFVVSDEILGKISTAAASSLPNMDGNSNSSTPNMKQDQPLAVLPDVVIFSRFSSAMEAKQSIILDDLKDWADQMEMESSTPLPVFGIADGSAWMNVNGQQRFSGWVASTLVPGATFKIKMALLNSLFQLLPGCIGLKLVLQNAVKLFCVEFASQESLTGAHCLQYAVVNFKDSSSAATTFSYWSVLVRKDSVRILPIVNQKKVISLKDAFKAKLTATSVVLSIATAADIDLAFGFLPKGVVSLLSVVFFGSNVVVNARLAFLETQLSELSLLIKFIVEPVGSLVVLVTKLLFTSSVITEAMKKSVVGLRNQINAVCAVASVLQKEVGAIKLRNMDNDNNDNNDVKNFLVYDDTFDAIIEL
ncbi:hypothetical protein G9A89_013559 [Geosiphon pyriformis]|nr:hypothetical protein G9A89_013559 [Geosiphon pyriformis]